MEPLTTIGPTSLGGLGIRSVATQADVAYAVTQRDGSASLEANLMGRTRTNDEEQRCAKPNDANGGLRDARRGPRDAGRGEGAGAGQGGRLGKIFSMR